MVSFNSSSALKKKKKKNRVAKSKQMSMKQLHCFGRDLKMEKIHGGWEEGDSVGHNKANELL